MPGYHEERELSHIFMAHLYSQASTKYPHFEDKPVYVCLPSFRCVVMISEVEKGAKQE